MPIIDSKTGKVIKDYTINELTEKAKEMRAWNMIALTAAKSGHTGGTLSIMDIVCALYLKKIRHDPKNPDWEDRDRVFWSVGHKAPALYVTLGVSGYFPIENVVKLRKLWSGFEGHPNKFKLPGIELSSGSLGQGFGVAIGSAINAKLEKKSYRVYCLMGDGEQQEGSIWESAMSASHYSLDNLVAVIDRNGLQIDGCTDDVMKIEPIADKYQAFGWNVIVVDGHDMTKLLEAFDTAEKTKDKPTILIADTVKGKCVSYAENIIGYHGITPKHGCFGEESLETALANINAAGFDKEKVSQLLKIADDYQKEVDAKVQSGMPKYKKEYWWNTEDKMKVKMEPTRFGFGRAIEKLGESKNVVAHGADITASIKMDDFYKNHPDRKNRFFSMGIAEQNMTVVASGLAKEGKIAFIGSYGVFVTGRNWDQIRTTACYNKFNVKIADAHGGVSVGPDGATHQALEEIALLYYLPNMSIEVPCDSVETEKSTTAIAAVDGPGTIRFAREATPIVTTQNTPFKFGVANIIRYRNKKDNFIDGFETKLATEYKSENEDISIIACGPIVPESMRAAYILKEEYGIETRIINMHTVKPIDKNAIIKAAEETSIILTAEEHQVGGFGNIVAGVIACAKTYQKPFLMDMVGVEDKFGDSGAPWELMKVFGLTAEHIAQKAKKLCDKKNKL